MKKFLLALPVCLLIVSCGGSGDSSNKADVAGPKSEYFTKFKFDDKNTLEGSVAMGQDMDAVKKSHTGDEMTDSDADYLAYERKIGGDPDYNYATYYYSFDEETGKLTYSTIDIYTKENKEAQLLYEDITASFTERCGKGKSTSSDGWVGQEWTAVIGGVSTLVTVERETKDETGWVMITFSEE